MQKLVHYDEKSGKIVKIYDKDTYCKVVTYVDVEADEESGEEAYKKEVVTYDTSKIPKPFKEVTYDEFRMALSIGANFFDAKTCKFDVKDFRSDEEKAKDLQRSLIEVCDYKHNGAKSLILGYKNTPGQIERYHNKYERAVKVKAQLDAGNEPTESNKDIVANYNTIIAKHKLAKNAIEAFTDLIEYFRGKVSDVIKSGDFEKAEELIEIGKSFNEKTTISDIDKLPIRFK